jgi:diguanylate cyclase (GGDEF)-like protein
MYSLYYVLTNQHGDEFAPVRCNEQTVKRLISYFEDVVTESNLSAFVIEGGCFDGNPSREAERLSNLKAAARHIYFFSCDKECLTRTWSAEADLNVTILEEHESHSIETGPFILVLDPRFCGLLASYRLPTESGNHAKTYEMVWTFDPNVVFTAIEYLLARINVQRPDERVMFEGLLTTSTPRNSSLRLALAFTTKLAMLMQRQNELEMATNRISSAISSTLEIEPILQSAVEEVGRALQSRRAALVLWQEGTSRPEGMSVYERGEDIPTLNGAALSDSSHQDSDETARKPGHSQDESSSLQYSTDEIVESRLVIPGPLEVPITYRNSLIGVLVVEDDTPGRLWQDEEVLMVKTVSDQLAVAISHARLFQQVQTQAMTDALTELFNHRYFQERLDREIKIADRSNEKVSLILLDLDHLKRINDTHGHRAGDAALCHAAQIMQSTVRDVDICARYGGEEFVIILPHCGREDAINVAERLREAIASKPVHKVGQVTASIGVATYPTATRTKEELIEMADRAMYLAKAAGRNRVRTLMHRAYTGIHV